MNPEAKIELCVALMDDDHGISEVGYRALLDQGLVPEAVQRLVKAIDSRYYLPEEICSHLVPSMGHRGCSGEKE
jgi:hypothetical protein